MQVHDEVKDKMFELELSWVGDFTDGVHQRVPEKVRKVLALIRGIIWSFFRFMLRLRSLQSLLWRRTVILMRTCPKIFVIHCFCTFNFPK